MSEGSDFTEKLPRDAEIGSISTMKNFAFLTTFFGTQWDYFTCVLIIHAEMSKYGVNEIEFFVEGKESLL